MSYRLSLAMAASRASSRAERVPLPEVGLLEISLDRYPRMSFFIWANEPQGTLCPRLRLASYFVLCQHGQKW